MSYMIGAVFSQLGVGDDDRSLLWRPEWAYQNRGAHLGQSWDLWPATRLGRGDPTSAGMFGFDYSDGGSWAPWEIGVGGKGGPSVFLTGRTLDINTGSPLAGVVVKGFLTSNDLYIGQTISDATGNYSLGSPYPSSTHYLVVYLPGSPDREGTTVNTITPA